MLKFSALVKKTLKYTSVSLIATAMDFIVFTICISLISKQFYVFSTLLGMLAGGVVSWTLHKVWVFEKSEVPHKKKRLRYIVGFILSVLLNLAFMYASREWLQMPLFWGRVATSITVWAIIYWFNSSIVFKIPIYDNTTPKRNL